MRFFLDKSLLFSLCFYSALLLSKAEPTCSQTSGEQCTEDSLAAVEVDGDGDSSDCGLWLAESTVGEEGELGVFLGVDIEKGEPVLGNGGDAHIFLYDINLREWSPLHEKLYIRDISVETPLLSEFVSNSFLAGVSLVASCYTRHANIILEPTEDVDDMGINRDVDPLAGSFTYRQHSEFVATQNLKAGQELLINCEHVNYAPSKVKSFQRDVDTLPKNGLCLDNIKVGPSTIPKAGRGAFVKRRIKKGEAIISSPVIQFDRSALHITQQEYNEDEKEIKYLEEMKGQQLLLNYCFGHPNSDILLLPTGPGVNYINHNSTPNAIIKWSEKSSLIDEDFMDLLVYELLDDVVNLVVEYVALQDLNPGDEIFLDYGKAWVDAFETHMKEWQKAPQPPTTQNNNDEEANYTSATQYRRLHSNEPIRTEAEQHKQPYPTNIVTSCKFLEDDGEEVKGGQNSGSFSTWTTDNDGCLRPCRILERKIKENGEFYYKAHMLEIGSRAVSDDDCYLSHSPRIVTDVPASAVMLTDKPYTTDEQLENAFRHEIGVPHDLYSDLWMRENKRDMGDFILPDLAPGQIESVRWAENGKVVTEHAYLIGLDPNLRSVLMDYCNGMGITEYFRNVTYRGNSLGTDETEDIKLGGLNWHLQRPPEHWNSNMHWISPLDAVTHEDYLQILSVAGFDEVLQKIGQHFKFDGLAAYHLSFIGVSHCNQGFLHKDVRGTGGKAFNLIIPLILAEETGPEFEVGEGEDDKDMVGRLRYQYNTGVMMGDMAFHATSAVNYRAHREMRMAATVYVADINKDNIENIMEDYTQHYPPEDEPDLLLSMAGSHWKSDDPNVKLPKPV